ncbi:hypothetical protein SKM52_05690 [Acinetobacter faecalis]|uniref:Uncharacterized protein n=1 Tax=Acinetobacter faecalis TaxID=2665161 RepID=A0A6L6GCM5_9GAMM|nr:MULTISPECIES: hypothetical protein [Acinetobacter]MDY6488233.1 hypothetical protein [Acinetobacter faecalis]MDY6510359.1 hypothetical protein [Acinetobacter faecalis]MDY6524043.1 hypothetical protein [Acinetobacter faecalis]MDY6529943.1 hypothetical protein [Acinetobacter faecalis]MDY6536169.1 hypothetical protein [Acinetobacter faecalis]
MKRVVLVIAAATFSIFGYMIYQYKVQQNELAQLEVYQSVIQDEGQLIFEAAQKWQKPISVDLNTSNLDDDYKIMADFVLNFMVQSAEARNTYLRELKALNWDKFLDVNRLDKDKKNKYEETEIMFIAVKEVMTRYQESMVHRDELALNEAKHLKVNQRFRRYLTDSFKEVVKQNNGQELFELEQQSFAKAQALFAILKESKWQAKNNMFMFQGDDHVKQFNKIYKEMIELDKQMKMVSQKNQKAIEASL